MHQYLNLLSGILEKGWDKCPARAGMPGSKSWFGPQMEFDLSEGFPLVTTKRMYWKGIVVELLWFLRGDTNIKYLLDNDVNIWNEDAYNYYLKKSKEYGINTKGPLSFEDFIAHIKKGELKWGVLHVKDPNYSLGDCGFQYGRVWRNWTKTKETLVHPEMLPEYYLIERNGSVDQIAKVINSIRNTPESRRLMVTAIDPAHDEDLALYWCHALFQFNCRPLSIKQRIQHAVDNFYLTKREMAFDVVENPNREIDEQLNEAGVPKYYLDCKLYQRSADSMLGVPFNIASYALLIELIARICNMIPGQFIHSFGDAHIYDNHMDAVKEQLGRVPKKLPKLHVLEPHRKYGSLPDHFEKYLTNRIDLNDFLKSLTIHDFRLEGYDPHPKLENETKLSTGLK
jgi:thymidylate synthase